ncbi:MAG: hypothetical protein ACRD5M_05155 [Candidatus Acidiferrales bacterium]
MIVLDEGVCDSKVGEPPLIVRLHKETARIAEDFRAQFYHAGKGCFDSLQGTQVLTGSDRCSRTQICGTFAEMK